MSSSAPPYHFETVGGHSIVTLHPSLNDVQWASIDQIGGDILGQIDGLRSPSVLVDLSGLSYVGSAMVALVVRIWKAVNEREGRMAVVNRNEMVLEVLRLAGLASVWTIVPEREEGLRALGARGEGSGGGNGVLAALAVVVTALSGAAMYAPQFFESMMSAAAVRGAGFALAAAGLILGTALAVRGAGMLRIIAVLLVLASIGSGVAGALRLPATAPPPTPESDADAGKEAGAKTQPPLPLKGTGATSKK